jgi:hypothetical protein
MSPETICTRFDALDSQRKNLDSVLQSIEEVVVPYRGEFFKEMTSEYEVHWRRRNLWSSTPIVSCQLLASQMHGSLTSPAVRWYGLKFEDEDLNLNSDAREWLEDCERRMWNSLLESDFNSESPELYLDIASYGTSIFMMEPKADIPDPWDGVDYTVWPIMDSYFEMGGDSRPRVVYRILRYTRAQLEDRFPDVDYDQLDLPAFEDVDTKVEVVFCVYWRDKQMDIEGFLAPNQRPVGYKYVMRQQKAICEEGGYYEFPAMVVRWSKVAGSVWGTSPAMQGLSDIRMLNETVAQVVEARSKVIDPPMMATETGIIGDLDLVPGGLTIVQDMGDLAPLQNFTNFAEAENEIARLEESIRATFFIDKLELKDSPAMTATEVNARQERMLRLMAPTMGRLQNDFLNPLVENLFAMMFRAGEFMEPPEILQNANLDIEYTGPIPRAQKMEVAAGIESLMGSMVAVAEVFPQALDKIDEDVIVDKLAELKGVPAEVIRSQAEVEAVRAKRQAQQDAMMQAQIAEQQGKGAQAVAEGEGAVRNLEAVQ